MAKQGSADLSVKGQSVSTLGSGDSWSLLLLLSFSGAKAAIGSM